MNGGNTMKELELKLISELMKNSRRSDRDLARELEKKAPPSDMMIMSGMGLDHSRVILSLHENFASFREFSLRESIFDVTSVESFVIGLDDKTHYRPFTLQTLAKYLPHM